MQYKSDHDARTHQPHTRPPYGIAYIVDELVGPTAGTENQLLALINALANTDFKPHLVALRSSKYLESGEMPCPVYVLDVPKLLHPNAIKRGWQLCAYLRQNAISIVHIYFNDSSIYAPVFCRAAGAKVIVSRRDLGFWYTWPQLTCLRANRIFVNRVIANCHAVQETVRTREAWPAGKLEVIYNGYDLSRFESLRPSGIRKRLGIPSQAPLVGMVANLHPYKRHEDLLDAFLRVHLESPESHLIVIGHGPRITELQGKARSLGLDGFVHFLGRITDVLPVIKDFAVCVLCSETEGLSNAIIEYMGCGKPVVATSVGGNKELVKDGVNGFLVHLRDIMALADRILLLLKTADLAQSFGSAGKKAVYQKFSLEKMISSHTSVYTQILREH